MRSLPPHFASVMGDQTSFADHLPALGVWREHRGAAGSPGLTRRDVHTWCTQRHRDSHEQVGLVVHKVSLVGLLEFTLPAVA